MGEDFDTMRPHLRTWELKRWRDKARRRTNPGNLRKDEANKDRQGGPATVKRREHIRMAEGNRPDFDVFAVREREGGSGKDIFVKIGVAFKRRNEAEGVNIMLDALPLVDDWSWFRHFEDDRR